MVSNGGKSLVSLIEIGVSVNGDAYPVANTTESVPDSHEARAKPINTVKQNEYYGTIYLVVFLCSGKELDKRPISNHRL
jgi:hypothetical protein